MKEHYKLYIDKDSYYEFTPEEWEEVFPQLDEKQSYSYFDGKGGELFISKKQSLKMLNLINNFKDYIKVEKNSKSEDEDLKIILNGSLLNKELKKIINDKE